MIKVQSFPLIKGNFQILTTFIDFSASCTVPTRLICEKSFAVEGSEYSFSCNQGYSLFDERGLKCAAEGKWNASLPSCLKGISSHFISTNSLRVELFKSCFSVLHNGFKTTRLGMKLNISFLYLALEFLAEK